MNSMKEMNETMSNELDLEALEKVCGGKNLSKKEKQKRKKHNERIYNYTHREHSKILREEEEREREAAAAAAAVAQLPTLDDYLQAAGDDVRFNIPAGIFDGISL